MQQQYVQQQAPMGMLIQSPSQPLPVGAFITTQSVRLAVFLLSVSDVQPGSASSIHGTVLDLGLFPGGSQGQSIVMPQGYIMVQGPNGVPTPMYMMMPGAGMAAVPVGMPSQYQQVQMLPGQAPGQAQPPPPKVTAHIQHRACACCPILLSYSASLVLTIHPCFPNDL